MSCTHECDEHWSYNDPSKWHDHFPAASGTSQSPIDIKSHHTVLEKYSPFVVSPDMNNSILFTLTNNGHQISVTLPKDSANSNNKDLSITGGGLVGKFDFVNFHLHWGKHDRHGAEHEIDGHQHPAEAHFVFKNAEAQQTAVLAFFFHVVKTPKEENTEWKKYTHIASLLTTVGETMNCNFNLVHLMQLESRRFFRYNGSLTTPPCTEGIIWTVFADSIAISEESLNLLRSNVMKKAYRPVQPLHHRTIHRNYD